MRLWKITIGLGACALVAGAGHAGAVTVGDVLASPETYDGKTLSLTGTIEAALPVGAESGYNLRDGTARVTVVSRTAPPVVGDHVTVTGVVHAFAGGDDPESKPFPPFVVETGRAPAP